MPFNGFDADDPLVDALFTLSRRLGGNSLMTSDEGAIKDAGTKIERGLLAVADALRQVADAMREKEEA